MFIINTASIRSYTLYYHYDFDYGSDYIIFTIIFISFIITIVVIVTATSYNTCYDSIFLLVWSWSSSSVKQNGMSRFLFWLPGQTSGATGFLIVCSLLQLFSNSTLKLTVLSDRLLKARAAFRRRRRGMSPLQSARTSLLQLGMLLRHMPCSSACRGTHPPRSPAHPPAHVRTDVQDGYTLPIGFTNPNWESAIIYNTVASILIEELRLNSALIALPLCPCVTGDHWLQDEAGAILIQLSGYVRYPCQRPDSARCPRAVGLCTDCVRRKLPIIAIC